jgi:cyanophycinase
VTEPVAATPATGPVALVGSGEYLPVMEEMERTLLDGRPPRYVQLATAAAPEGAASLRTWHDLGAHAARRLGVEQVVVPVVDRESAQDQVNAALVAGAGLIYLSGGDPLFLVETLRETAVWRAIEAAWRAGAALAGCSAGAMALAGGVPDLRHPWRPAVPGLGAVPRLEVLPHFDRYSSWMPDLVLRRLAAAPPGVQVVGIDEDTALVAGMQGWQEGAEPAAPGTTWSVVGRRSVWLLDRSGRLGFFSGSAVRLGTSDAERAASGPGG